jgi:hypothetical protein
MLLSVLIVNFRTGRMTSECVASFKGALGGCDHEIIVVDNHSQDNSVETVRGDHPDVTIVQAGTNLGFGAAVNLGVSRAAGKYLVVSNSDILAKPGFAEGLVEFYEANRAGILGIKLVKPDGSVQPSFGYFPTPLEVVLNEMGPLKYVRRRHLRARAAIDEADSGTRRVDWVTGAFMFISRDNFRKIGGFDEAFFMYYEDVDLSKRALDLGLATFYVAEYAAGHRHCGTSAALPRCAYNVNKVEERRSALVYLTKHHPRQVTRAATGLEAVFRWTLAGLYAKYYGLWFSASRRERNRYKVNTYKELVETVRSMRRR